MQREYKGTIKRISKDKKYVFVENEYSEEIPVVYIPHVKFGGVHDLAFSSTKVHSFNAGMSKMMKKSSDGSVK